MRFEDYLILGLGGVVLAWLGVSLFVIASRGLYDLERRWVRAAETLADDALGRLPRREILRVAGDASTPPAVAAGFARFAVARWRELILRHAARHRGELTRWRRVGALRILARAEEPSALPLLERAVGDPDRQLVGAAVAVLGTLPDRRAAGALVDALRELRFPPSRVATFLDRFPLAVPELIRPLLRDPDPQARFWGATLAARYPESQALHAELVRLARDDDPNVRAAAVETLGSIGDGESAAAANDLLADPVWYVRAHAARALGVLRAEATAPAVAGLLSDESWWVRFAAKEALERMGPGIADAVIPYLTHGDRFARNGAAEVLQNIGAVDAVVAEAAAAPEQEESLALVRRIFAAGGPSLAAATLARARPTARAFVARELTPKGGPT